ncbi:MAG TPA: FAD-dependent oxidoreductase [Candidatus Acidoferrales bacterium]|jgi:protoporphyrinogen oxidase|nr:FAD-dependent oxidoreductase [Candidatus Acidoferrales bacterium]
MNRPENPSRRDAIKFLIGGAVAAACPFPLSAAADAAQAAGAAPASVAEKLGSEESALCHQVRDGFAFKFPPPAAEHEVVIVGGGPSGLISAYRLRDKDFLLLEKEPRLGGNAISEQWRDQWYSTGAAYQGNPEVEALCREIGMEIHRIKSVDASIIQGQVVPEFWNGGLWKSPYPDAVKKQFAALQKDMQAVNVERDAAKLDNMTFAELLQPYGPEVKAWFDNYGPNNWGGDTHNTSALIGAQAVEWQGGDEPNRYTWPGGLGRISLALEDALKKSAPAERLRRGATVLQILPTASGKVNVSFSENGTIQTVAGKTVVVACPKFIAKRLVAGLDDAHLNAMDALRYIPYVVVNVCFNRVIYNGSYDTDIPAPCPIVDFNVADWVINRDNKEQNRTNVLTCYVPRPERERPRILSDDYVLGLGHKVLDQLEEWFPGCKAHAEEVRIYRRGHAMVISAPGFTTRVAPEVRKPMGNIFFGHSDSEGYITEYTTALKAANRVAKEVTAALGKQAARSTIAVPAPAGP